MQRQGVAVRLRIGNAYDALSCICPAWLDAGRSDSPPEIEFSDEPVVASPRCDCERCAPGDARLKFKRFAGLQHVNLSTFPFRQSGKFLRITNERWKGAVVDRNNPLRG